MSKEALPENTCITIARRLAVVGKASIILFCRGSLELSCRLARYFQRGESCSFIDLPVAHY